MSFEAPQFLWGLLVLPLVPWLAMSSRLVASRTRRWFGVAVRMVLLTCLVLACAAPATVTHDSLLCAVAVVDASESVSDTALQEAFKWVEQARAKLDARDRFDLVVFGGQSRRATTGLRAPLPTVAEARLAVASSFAASDPGQALALAESLAVGNCLPRVALVTDGLPTRGDVLSTIAAMTRRGVRVEVAPTIDAPPFDVAVTSLTSRGALVLGQPFELVAEMRATSACRATVRLLKNDQLDASSPERVVELVAGSNTIRFQGRASAPGPVNYRVQVATERADHYADNDHRELTLEVPGSPRVLVVDAEVAAARHMVAALEAQRFAVEVRSPMGLPLSVEELEPFDFVIASNLAREQVSGGAERVLQQWVRNRGGGLLVTGGRSAFAAGGWQGTSFERFWPLQSPPPDREQEPTVALVLVVDRSSSMEGLPIEMARNACAAAVSVLNPSDMVEVLGFNTEAARIVTLQPASHRSRIVGEIARVEAQGGTHLLAALELAQRDLSGVRARRRHVVVLSDGLDAPDGLLDQVRAMAAEQTTVSVVALGAEADHDLLRQLAEVGGGRFHPASDPRSLPRIFVDETQLASDAGIRDNWCFAQRRAAVDFLSGVDISAAPALHGVSDVVLASQAQGIVTTDTGAPLLARWKRGAGWVLAFASDLRGDWSTEWVRWGAFPRLLAQLVRAHGVDRTSTLLPMKLSLEGDELVASFDLLDASGDYDVTARGTVRVESLGTGLPSWELPLRPVAPGRYIARGKLPSLGEFRVEAALKRRAGKPLESVEQRVTVPGANEPPEQSDDEMTTERARGTLARPFPEELARFTPDQELLTRMARAAGTNLAQGSIEGFVPHGESRRGLKSWVGRLLAAALLLLLVDVALRRLPPWKRGRASEGQD
jgi:Ca-activated chloride channel family protein